MSYQSVLFFWLPTKLRLSLGSWRNNLSRNDIPLRKFRMHKLSHGRKKKRSSIIIIAICSSALAVLTCARGRRDRYSCTLHTSRTEPMRAQFNSRKHVLTFKHMSVMRSLLMKHYFFSNHTTSYFKTKHQTFYCKSLALRLLAGRYGQSLTPKFHLKPPTKTQH